MDEKKFLLIAYKIASCNLAQFCNKRAGAR